MSCNFRVVLVAYVASMVCSVLQAAPISVTFQDYTPGVITPGTLDTTAYKATPDAKFQDFPRDTGGGTNKFARGLSNNSFAASTILPIGKGGGLTLKFEEPIFALPGTKEFVIHNGNFLSSSGGFFYGDMEAAILVSNDNLEWRTLTGHIVADPLTYTATIHEMNAPTMSYVWGTGKIAWDYPTGAGRPQSVLDTFPLADYGMPMPNDSLFNGSGTNADRAAFRVSTDAEEYSSIFGASAGGNWFDLSNSGLPKIQYLRINVDANAPVTVRLDSVFANPAALVPEPLGLASLAIGAIFLGAHRRKRTRRCPLLLAVLLVWALSLSTNEASAATFSDIKFWVGNGSNQAALVIDWNDGKSPESLIWGYRWDGTATGENMLTAIVQADPKLYATYSTTFGGGLGTALFGLGYDTDGDGFSTTPALVFNNSIAVLTDGQVNDFRSPADSDDHYFEGWWSGYWSYWLGGEDDSPAWGYSGVGMSSRILSNGSWDGWSALPGFMGDAPSEPIPATIPEPASVILALATVVMLSIARRPRKMSITASGNA